jgi:hypothetical protein
MLIVVPIIQIQAFEFVAQYHRHHNAPVGSIFQVAVKDSEKTENIEKCGRLDLFGEGISVTAKRKIDPKIVGVAVVGRPVARRSDDGLTLEVTRLCTDGTKNVCSMLYAACWRASKALGYVRLITYILNTEPGTSLKASGWKLVGERGGGSWSVPSRPREDKHPLTKKFLYEKAI